MLRFCMRLSFVIYLTCATLTAIGGTCDDATLAQTVADQLAVHTPMDRAHSQLLGVQLGVSDLDQVMTVLGAATRLPRTEGAPERVCYVGKSTNSPIVVFEAGAMGGWRYLTAFCILSAREGKPLRKQCAVNDNVNADVSTEGGLKLGVSMTQATHLLGKATVSDKTKIHYWHTYQTAQKTDVTEYVGLTHANGEITGVRVSKVESN